MSDVEQTIRTALQQDKRANLDARHLKIDVGKSVTLSGEVDSLAAKRRLTAIAWLAAEKRPVVDAIKVKSHNAANSGILCDELDKTLRSDGAFAGIVIVRGEKPQTNIYGWISIDSPEAGVLKLSGTVPSLSHWRLAEVYAWWLTGTCLVDNQLQIVPSEDDNDGEISEALRQAMDKDPGVDCAEVHTLVRDGEIRLTGRVATRAQAEHAEYTCWATPGVRQVSNELEVIANRSAKH